MNPREFDLRTILSDNTINMVELSFLEKDIKAIGDLCINLDKVLFETTLFRNELQEQLSVMKLRLKEIKEKQYDVSKQVLSGLQGTGESVEPGVS